MQKNKDLPWRRPCITANVGQFAVTVGFNPDDEYRACEVFMTKRAKSGTDLEDIMYELGVTVSKIMQGEIE